MHHRFTQQINRYIVAKDNHKPHWMPGVFAADAKLQFVNTTGAIDFPDTTVGEPAITRILVEDFNQRFGNTYTFCLEDRCTINDNLLRCRWLVAMSRCGDGQLHLGHGIYDWIFGDEPVPLVHHLTITIDAMTLPEHAIDQATLFSQLGQLSHPWCLSAQLKNTLAAESWAPGWDALLS